ncbi:DEAD H (Asp-Glu-Ala-Asp His) box helicase 11 [Rhizophlyctis rosea]|uniref:ATP-dependent DNA helicase CHL1 n=1 Tax=Rhizophlyctis rosea TaxID=64517 RepID=A0AAD5SJA5_9FUNG|nr:DEAD H (Asp-Glu-Ala-Asp His) box helicase 11 [Rhizophlyctis rosea]
MKLRRQRSDADLASNNVRFDIDGKTFSFPFQPWEIQKEFMSNLYETLENGQVGVFESPTGTGKSLSLICGALKWLRDHQNRSEEQRIDEYLTRQNPSPMEDDPDLMDWEIQYETNRRREDARRTIREHQEARARRAERVAQLRRQEEERKRYRLDGRNYAYSKRARTEPHDSNAENNSDNEEFLVDEYESDGEAKMNKESLRRVRAGRDLLQDSQESEEEDYEDVQILYCSRTHSQVSQFINEIKKTVYADARSVSLGARKTLCVNQTVRNLGTEPRINDKCLDLQKESNPQKRCEYKPDKEMAEMFADKLHVSIRDIEDIASMGKDMSICPYYGSRDSIKSSEIVAMPYPILLSKSARESYGIRLKDNIVIIDEAHNITNAVTSLHTVEIDLQQIDRAHNLLKQYFDKYQRRLKGKNVTYIRQILGLLMNLGRYLKRAGRNGVSIVKSVVDFTHEAGVDNVNVLKLKAYLDESRLAQKLQGFTEKYDAGVNEQVENTPDNEEWVPKHVSALQQVQQFLVMLSQRGDDGRVIVTGGESNTKSTLKYLLLNPADSFKEVLEEARAVVLAGGTMEPVEELKMELLPTIADARFTRFQCDHIIPPTSLLTMVVGCGPTGAEFRFDYDGRGDVAMIHEAGKALSNFLNVIPGGVVCFFPSFSYMDCVIEEWRKKRILETIGVKKHAFMEPHRRDGRSVLQDYTEHVRDSRKRGTRTGAILFAVVNGKMSEGINFSDDLGRAVVMIGIPFPPREAPEIKEKLAFVGARAAAQFPDHAVQAAHAREDASNQAYTNVAMKGVNQSIGRAIRHKDDYAVVLLLDTRYAERRIMDCLPGWLKKCRVEVPEGFGDVQKKLREFFKEKEISRAGAGVS